jgi:hypothetical protein
MIFGEEYRAYSSLLCSLLHSPVTSSLLGPNILLSRRKRGKPKVRWLDDVQEDGEGKLRIEPSGDE